MARHSRQSNDARRAAQDASSLVGARAAQRRDDARSTARRNDARGTYAMPANSSAHTHRSSSRTHGSQQQGIGAFVRDNIVGILSVTAVAIIVVLLALFLRVLAPPADVETGGTEEVGYVSPYDWTKLDRTNNRYAYIVNGETKSFIGVDVSENQHDIDWKAVAADGIDFAMIRLGYRGATEGGMYLDEYYWTNLAGAKEAGVKCGVYFFSQANNTAEAVEEAEYVIENLQGIPLEYPIAFDSEDAMIGETAPRTSGLSDDEMTAIAEAFCARVEQAGYQSMIYGNVYDMSRYHYSSMADDRIWWAEYDIPSPNADLDIVMWQYSNAGEVAGIPTYVDMNLDLTHALA